MKIWLLPLSLGLIAIISGNLTFFLAFDDGFIEGCIPYFQGCSSISKAGREGLGAIIFKLTIMPVMTLISIYWMISYIVIKKFLVIFSKKNKYMLVSGITGSLFGILYTAFLGSEGETYQFLRRFGIYLFFLGTYSAQIIEVIQLKSIYKPKTINAFEAMKLLTLLVGLIILISIPFYGLIENDDWLENVLEWNITFLIFSYFILSSLVWKKISIQVKASNNHLERGRP